VDLIYGQSEYLFFIIQQAKIGGQEVDLLTVGTEIPGLKNYLLDYFFTRKAGKHFEQAKAGNVGKITRIFDKISQSLNRLINHLLVNVPQNKFKNFGSNHFHLIHLAFFKLMADRDKVNGLSSVLFIQAFVDNINELYFSKSSMLSDKRHFLFGLKIADNFIDLVSKFWLIVFLDSDMMKVSIVLGIEF